jgi:mono/diheme cytochrome c family protein
VLLALTTNQKLGLAGTAVVFITFALISALLIPRSRPDFPGRRGLVAFVLVTAILTIAMLGAVEVFAKESHEGEASAEPTETVPQPEPEPMPEPEPQEPAPMRPTTTEPTATAEQPSGSPEAGKAVFAAQGCGGCHTFSPAGSNGTVGPNLDDVLAGKDAAFVHESIVSPNAEIAQGFSAGVMPQDYEQKLSPKQLDDLVAFLTSG